MGNTAQHCRLGLFQDSDFAGDLEDSKSTSVRESYVSLDAERMSPSVGCASGKHQFLTVQQNLKLSLDAGLRLDGLLALELWDLIVSVFGNISHISDRTGKPVNGKINLTIKSMLCKTLIWFPQMFNPQVVKLYCMCLRTMRL